MISIDRIRICQFRSIDFLQMPLSNRCVLFGANNCGKSTVLKACQLALSDAALPSKSDFHIQKNQQSSHEFFIDIRLVPINTRRDRIPQFSHHWAKEFNSMIMHDHRRFEYFSFRTVFLLDEKNNTIQKTRYLINNWDQAKLSEEIPELPKSIKFVFLHDQNNLQTELNTDHSFLSNAIEQMHQEPQTHPKYLNEPTEDIRNILNRLSETLQGPGASIPAEIELTPAKIGYFFQQIKNNEFQPSATFPLQGHGSQKSAFILATLLMIEALYRQALAHDWPLFIMIASEEPETHLHPNAQRTLMQHLIAESHQLLVSTHSPYITAMCEPDEYRSLSKVNDRIDVRWLPRHLDSSDIRTIKRLILRFKGETLFARGLIFVEGITEEQLIRGMFHAYFGDDPNTFGISIIGVDGKSYAPYLLLAMSLRKPFCIVSDNDGDSYYVVTKQLREIEKKVQVSCENNRSQAFFLSPGLAMEGELVFKTSLHQEILDALIACSDNDSVTPKNRALKRNHLMQVSPRELKRNLERKKSEYSGFLGDIIEENPYNQPLANMIPKAIQEALLLVESWIYH